MSTFFVESNFVIRQNFICTSSNIIYCISCSKCCKLYICETGQRLSDRFAEHLRSVRNNDVDKPVVGHFSIANHYSISNIKVCAVSPIFGGHYSHKRQEKRLIFVCALVQLYCCICACADILLSEGCGFDSRLGLRNIVLKNRANIVHLRLNRRMAHRSPF